MDQTLIKKKKKKSWNSKVLEENGRSTAWTLKQTLRAEGKAQGRQMGLHNITAPLSLEM